MCEELIQKTPDDQTPVIKVDGESGERSLGLMVKMGYTDENGVLQTRIVPVTSILWEGDFEEF